MTGRKNCSKCLMTSDEESLTCPVCESVLHAKCVKINKTGFAIITNNPNVFWVCDKCVDMTLLTVVKKVDAISAMLSVFSERIGNVEKVVTTFATVNPHHDTVETLPVVPSAKTSKTVSSRVHLARSVTAKSVPKTTTPVPKTATSVHKTSPQPQALSSVPTLIRSPPISLPLSSPSLPSASTSTPTSAPCSSAMEAKKTEKSITTMTNEKQKGDVNVNSKHSNTPLITGTGASSELIAAAEQHSTMFVTNCSGSTTAEQLATYIASKIQLETDTIRANLCIPKDRPVESLNYLSFKLSVPLRHANTVLDAGFWPQNIRIRKFVAGSNRNQQKNQR